MRWKCSWIPFLFLCCFHMLWSSLISVGDSEVSQQDSISSMESITSSLTQSLVFGDDSVTLDDEKAVEGLTAVPSFDSISIEEALAQSAVVDSTTEQINKESLSSKDASHPLEMNNSNGSLTVEDSNSKSIASEQSEDLSSHALPSASHSHKKLTADTVQEVISSSQESHRPDLRKLSVIMGSLSDAESSSMSSLPNIHNNKQDENTQFPQTFQILDTKFSTIEQNSSDDNASITAENSNMSIKLPSDNEIPVLIPPVEISTGTKKDGVSVEDTADSENMPSFKEWTEKRLAEQEKTGGNGPSTASAQGKISSVPKMRQKNYASSDCGAKIIGTNPEAKTSSAILNNYHDEYMLNPCTAKIWFVIELCEPIQARKIDVANFELYSSSPKEFSVFSSDRYPSRDWVFLGTYVAQDEKTIQSFPLEQQSFHKYLKLEMSSHYGSEHYCPLSLVRAYGTSELEVLDTETESGSEPFEIPAEDDSLQEEEFLDKPDLRPQSLLKDATDAVLSIVKRAREALSGDKLQSTQIGNATLFNGTDDFSNFTSEEKLDERSSGSLCMTLQRNFSISDLDVFKMENSSYVTAVQKVLSCEFMALNNLLQLSIIREILLRCSEQLNKKDSSKDCSPHEARGICQYLKALLGPVRYVALSFLHKWKEEDLLQSKRSESYPNCTKPSAALPESEFKGSMFIPSVISLEPALDLSGTSAPSGITATDSISETLLFNISQISDIKASSDLKNASDIPTNLSLQEQIHPTKTIKSEDYMADIVLNESTVSSKEEISSPDLAENIVVPSVDISVSPTSDKLGTDVVEESVTLVSSSDSAHKTKVTSVDESTVKEDLPILSTSDSSGMDQMTSDASSSSDGTSCTGEHCTISDSLLLELTETSTSSTSQQPSQPVIVSTVTGPGVANKTVLTSSVQKESVFVRLSNRIKALELNMSLSSQYLEELSQRYRKQMEEMQKAFNKTVAALNETARKAFERDLKQQESINGLTMEIKDLKKAVEMLQSERESISLEVIERHVFLIFLELFIAVVIFLMCRRQASVTPSSPRYLDPPLTAITDVSCSDVSNEQLSPRRRNSFAGATAVDFTISKDKRRASEETLDKSGSYSDLMIVEPTIPIMMEPPSQKTESKRKKQKNKKGSRELRRSLSNQNIGNHSNQQSQSQPSSNSGKSVTKVTSAGLLFCSNQEDTKVEGTVDCLPPLPPKNATKDTLAKCSLEYTCPPTNGIKRIGVPEVLSHSSNGHVKNGLQEKTLCASVQNGCISLSTKKQQSCKDEDFFLRKLFLKVYSYFK